MFRGLIFISMGNMVQIQIKEMVKEKTIWFH